jgi:hypothetical protein
MALSHDRSRSDGPQRWASILVGAAVIGLVAYLTLESRDAAPVKKDTTSTTPTAPSADAGAPVAAPPADAGTPEPELDVDGGLFLPTLSLGDAGVMPSGAPRSVKIGVVLVSFAGAEGAPPNARSKKDAQAIAERLGADARTDFHRAVTGGDPGSSDDIGRLPRGVLDPRTEIAVFGLGSGEVSDVLETPRGYWIVKRID